MNGSLDALLPIVLGWFNVSATACGFWATLNTATLEADVVEGDGEDEERTATPAGPHALCLGERSAQVNVGQHGIDKPQEEPTGEEAECGGSQAGRSSLPPTAMAGARSDQ